MTKANQKGFTLLEIMVAIAIIAIAFTSVISLHTRTVAMNIASNFHARAPLLAQKLISDWETGMATGTSIPASGDSLEDFPGFTFELSHKPVDSDDLYAGTPDTGDRVLFELACTILYNHGEYRYTAKALRFRAQ